LRHALKRIRAGEEPFAPSLQVAVELAARGLSASPREIFHGVSQTHGIEDALDIVLDARTVYLAPREEFDGALLRVEDGVAIYSAERVIEVYMSRDGMSEEVARDFFLYNCEGGCPLPHAPHYEWEGDE
jgi:hypothetical protein